MQLRLFNNEEKVMSEIKATKRGNDRVAVVNYDFPEDTAGLLEKFGEDVVHSSTVGSLTIDIQSLMRRHIEKSDEEIQALVDAWVPGVRQPGVKKSPLERARAAVSGMSAEDRAELLRSLQG